jgi:hypothetical protein
MKTTLLTLALLGSQSVILISDRVPHLNVEALCKDVTGIDVTSDAKAVESCMHDETDAQQQLNSIWQTTPTSVRDPCEGEAAAGGIQSYVDLLTCIQMTDEAKSLSSSTPLKGASKNRNRK